jgi:hypothetical protein
MRRPFVLSFSGRALCNAAILGSAMTAPVAAVGDCRGVLELVVPVEELMIDADGGISAYAEISCLVRRAPESVLTSGCSIASGSCCPSKLASAATVARRAALAAATAVSEPRTGPTRLATRAQLIRR